MLTPERLKEIQQLIRRMPVPESVVEAILTLVRSARPGQGNAETDKHVAWGPGPRASQALTLCARARALYDGRLAPSIDDVHALAEPVLQHRMALTFAARAEGMTVRDVDRASWSRQRAAWRESARRRRTGRRRATRSRAARMRASLVPDLLVEARRIVNTVIAGWHGRRKRGIGENFWQFRPYVDGEAMSRIDWRRSARDDHTYVRDREWEAAHTVWLWADPSPSMLYKSQRRTVSKESRALVLVLALAELLSRSGERIAWPGLTDPFTARNGAERLASHLDPCRRACRRGPISPTIRRFSDIVIASDFLDPVEETMAWLDVLARHGVRAHLIEVADPAEETFPYAGRTEFTDPETGEKLTAGRAEQLRDDYRSALSRPAAQELAAWCKRLGWSYTVNHTDRLASEALVRVHMAMTADGGYAAGLRA